MRKQRKKKILKIWVQGTVSVLDANREVHSIKIDRGLWVQGKKYGRRTSWYLDAQKIVIQNLRGKLRHRKIPFPAVLYASGGDVTLALDNGEGEKVALYLCTEITDTDEAPS